MVEYLNLDLGMAILGGFLMGAPVAAFGGIFLARVMNRKFDIPLRDVAGSSTEELKTIVSRREEELPGFLASIAPVALPVILITTHSIVDALRKGAADPQAYAGVLSVTSFFGDKFFALGLGTAIAIWVLARQRNYSMRQLTESLEPALLAAGVIILITCAGGAFGDMLKRTGIGPEIRTLVGSSQTGAGLLFIFLAWGVAAVMKIAQGSGTVAMITGSSIMASLLQGGVQLPYHPIYIFAAVAFGSMVISWMNDSGFWVVCKMSGFAQDEALKTWTVLLGSMGMVGLVEVVVLSSLLPLA
jgi:GntP family gluconate:H+ symporter